jgi:hypothetical protein
MITIQYDVEPYYFIDHPTVHYEYTRPRIIYTHILKACGDKVPVEFEIHLENKTIVMRRI